MGGRERTGQRFGKESEAILACKPQEPIPIFVTAESLILGTDIHKNISPANQGGPRADETAPDEIIETECPGPIGWSRDAGPASRDKMKRMAAGKPSVPAMGINLPDELAG